MTQYDPHRWLVIRIGEDNYRVFGTWLGGYTTGDSWRLNSGIVRVEQEGDFLLFHGSTGSVYRCHKDAYGASGWSYSVLQGMIEKTDAEVTVFDEDTDWLSLEVS